MILRSSMVLMLALATAVFCWISPEPRTGDDSGVVMSLPESAGVFAGRPGEVSQIEKDVLPSDTGIVRMEYRTTGLGGATQDLVTASIILAGSERRSIHRPEVCLTGQGWSLIEARTIPVSIAQGEDMLVRDLLIEKPVTLKTGEKRMVRAHYVYWFVGGDVTTPSHWTRMWLSARDSVLRNVNHRWAYPALMAMVTDGFKPGELNERNRTADETLTLITALIRELAPKFQKSLMTGAVAATTP
jgi:Protein of unknown function (DUF3485)